MKPLQVWSAVKLAFVEVPPQDAPVVEALDKAWADIAKLDKRIPEHVGWYLTGGRSTSCAQLSWDTDQVVLRINLQTRPDANSDPVNRTGEDLVTWLAHVAAHAVVAEEPPAGGEGRYHNPVFRDAARELGLDVEKGTTGWSSIELGPLLERRLRPDIKALNKALAAWKPEIGPRRNQRGPWSLRCACTPPRTIVTPSGNALKGRLTCGICRSDFKIDLSTVPPDRRDDVPPRMIWHPQG
jgi:hypothetical protein